jgi:transposase-like protein
MSKDNVIELNKQEIFVDDPITDILRQGARKLLAEALHAEIESFLSQYSDIKDDRGCMRVTRNGYLPEREIQTGIGPVPVKVPRVRDRQSDNESERIRFTSFIMPPYLRKTKSMEELMPWLYLKGISTGDFREALAALVGKDAPGLSAPTISRLKIIWQEDLEQWQKRDLSNKRFVYIWADGIYCNVRMEEKQCLLVIIGATKDGKKELLGFWKALAKVYDDTRWQRCWVHKTANVLNKLPKSIQAKAKEKLHMIWMAPEKDEAEQHFDDFIKIYEAKYPKATECLEKDSDVLLTFYDFPAEHWRHIRTTNPIESTFATVRLRTAKVRSCFSSKTVVTMAFKLCQSAEKRWQRLHHSEKLAEVIEGVIFVSGIKKIQDAA